MADLGWLFAWAKENGIECPNKDGAADIPKLLRLYNESRAKSGGKEYRQNESDEKTAYDSRNDFAEQKKRVQALQSGGREQSAAAKKPKPEKATGFNRLETKHHQRHAKEMGFKNTKEYERAAVEFFNSDSGELSYSIARKRWYRYDKGSGFFVSSSDGIVHTFYRLTEKQFRMKEKQDDCIKY